MKQRLHKGVLRLDADGAAGHFRAALPTGAAGAWCRLKVGLADGPPWWAKLEATDHARGQVVREAFLGRLHSGRSGPWRTTLVHLPASAHTIALRLFTAEANPPRRPWATLRVLSRSRAAMSLLAHGWQALPRALAGDAMGLPGRVRAVLGQAPARDGEAPPYSLWIRLYDCWGQAERDAVMRRSDGNAPVSVIIVGADRAKMAATLACLDAQWLLPSRVDLVTNAADFVAADSPWVLVLQAGEVLRPHALACFMHAANHCPQAGGFYADIDIGNGDVRTTPLFKPQADPWLLGSGLLTSGACLFRGGLLTPGAGLPDADAWRRHTALAAGADALRHIPAILTHLPQPPPSFRNAGPKRARVALPFVSIIVPSAGRSSHVLRCLRQVVAATAYPNFEMLIAVSCVDGNDAAQARILQRLRRLPRVRVLDLGLGGFNYAAANNAAIRQARGEMVLLLNDDIVPLRPDWLQRMVAFTTNSANARAGVVGARLLYGNGMVQHGGVIVGLANLCEHAFRLAPGHHPGPYGMALLDRQVSAVTGACMLVSRSLYETLGGLDESFVIALNDVDFCLRAGEAGARVVLAAEVALYHYESLSLGRHYKGARAGLEAVEVSRLRDRWTHLIAADPFYNPCASLMPGREFLPGFPSRCTPLSWIDGEMPLPR